MRKVFSEILGEYIEVPDNPKIVSLAPSITDTLYRIGVWDQVVGVSLFCNIPKEASSKPRVGAYLKVSYKRLDELSPDIVLTTTGVQRNLTLELKEKGYNVYPIPLPISIYGIVDNIVLTGYVVGAVDRALEVAGKYLRLLDEVEGFLDAKVYYEICFEDPYTIGKYSYITTSLYHIGLRNIFMGVDKSYFKPDFKEVLELNPEVIIYEMNPGKEVTYNEVIEMFEERGWGGIRALRENRVFIVGPDTLAHYGPTHIQNLISLYKKIISRY